MERGVLGRSAVNPIDATTDRTATFVKLLARHDSCLVSFVLTMVPNWSDAEDIIQETKVRLWEQFGSYDPSKDFGTWACVIARYQILAFRARSARSRIVFSQELVDRLSDELARTETQSDARLAFLERCVEKLGDWQRDLLMRCSAAGHGSLQKLASQFGRTPGALRQALLRIRYNLYRCVEEAQKEADRP
jgi:RNA polymerase sigma-70 factor, ECF subfamily